MSGFVYPNEVAVEWDLLIVIYPFITGLVAGAFVISSLHHVFGLKSLKPVARFSLIASLAFLLVTPLPLAVHLGRPERALEMFLTPNLSSAMSGFGYIWLLYLLLVLVETWLVFRPDIVRYAESSVDTKKTIYSILALGVYDVSKESLALDHKITRWLALLGIPMASLLHGYVGFIFGAVKANPWWSTPLMPIIFLLSAIVSGIALLMVMYVIVSRLRKTPVDPKCLRTLALLLSGFLLIDVVLELLEVFTMLYESEESWNIVSQLITQVMGWSYFGIQIIMGSAIPLIVLVGAEIARVSDQAKIAARSVSAALVVIGVFTMRWNVVIGGQLMSKSLRGFTSYFPEITGVGGVLAAATIMALPLVIFAVVTYLIPPWVEETPEETRQSSLLRRRSAL